MNVYFCAADLSLYLRVRHINAGNCNNVLWSEIMFLVVVSDAYHHKKGKIANLLKWNVPEEVKRNSIVK